ncbi:MAG: hypothetical protein HY827_08115 [Actinobacteria bacterium]|nr:hypothetical protein [Actinomycetota bacterium]
MIRSASFARPKTAKTLFSLFAACVALLAVASVANAGPVTIGDYTYYTTADLCKLDLTPETASRQTGETHTVTATLTSTAPPITVPAEVGAEAVWSACFRGNIAALVGAEVKFSVTAGPHAGTNGTVGLDASGKALFSYTGTLAGTDSIKAELVLPDLCDRRYNGIIDFGPQADLPVACEYQYGETNLRCPWAIDNVVEELPVTCPYVTLSDTANVTWSAPQVVTQQADPTITIAAYKRCVSHRFRISPVYGSGTVKSSTLFVDGKKIATNNGPEGFLVNGPKYKTGKHNFEVVTSFTNGKSASKFGSFSRCKVRTAARTVSPRFTG